MQRPDLGWSKWLWIACGGFEYNLVLLALSGFFGLYGPGRYSLDTALGLAWPQLLTFAVTLSLALRIAVIALIAPSWMPRFFREAA